MVVSNPTDRNTTCSSLCSFAYWKASVGEYTTCIFPPSALAAARLFLLPGTRTRSPNVQIVTFFSRASQIASSIKSAGVTQTGQPGPEIRFTCSGSSFRIPSRNISWVCVPQTSMIRTGGPS